MKYWVGLTASVALASLLLAGCDAPPAAQPTASSNVSGGTRSDRTVRPNAITAGAKLETPEPARSFASIQEAVDVLSEAAETGDSAARIDATKYLIAQGAASIQPLAAQLSQPDVPPRTAIAVCRTLGQLGPNAAAPLKAALKSETSIIRVNAAEQLAIIKPTNLQIVDTLIALLDDDDPQVRLIAVRGLSYIGKPAQKSAKRLQTILNSAAETDTLRTAAGDALKKVDPRRSLVE